MKIRICALALLLAFCCGCMQPRQNAGEASGMPSTSPDSPSAPAPAPLPSAAADLPPSVPPGGRICLTDDGTISFIFGEGWLPAEENGAFDLQCVAQESGLTTGVFCYTRENAPMQWDPVEALDFHVEDLKERREAVTVVEEKVSRDDGAHRYTTMLLEGGLDGKQFCYYFTLIEFTGFSERFAVVLQTAEKGALEKSGRVEFDGINASSALVVNIPADGGGQSI